MLLERLYFKIMDEIKYTDEYIKTLLRKNNEDISFDMVVSDIFYSAVKCVVDYQTVSAITLTKLLKIGYGKAEKLIKCMKILGVITNLGVAKDCEVLPEAQRFLNERKASHQSKLSNDDIAECFEDNTSTKPNVALKIKDLVLPEAIKNKLMEFVRYTTCEKIASNLLLVGCDPKCISIIAETVAGELGVNAKNLYGIGDKQGDVAQVLTKLSCGDVVYVENLLNIPTEILGIFTEALRNHSITITLGKGAAEKTIHLPLIDFRTLIYAENIDKVPNDILEACYHVIDFSKMKSELRVIDILDFSNKYNIIFTEPVIEILTREHLDDTQFRRRLIEIRNRAYEANVKIVTEELLHDFKSIPDFNEIEIMDGHDFEIFVANLFSLLGYYNVKVTPSSHDFGADVIAEKDDVKFAIQCKRYSSPVGVSAVQEVIASKSLHDCHVACVLTNSTFTPAAEELARKNLVILWDGNKLKDFLRKVN